MPDEGKPPQRPGARSTLLSFARRRRAKPATPAPEEASYRNPLRPFSEQNSLFGEILDWMLAPLLLLWPMSVTLTYLVAQSIANGPFDRNLGEAVGVLSDHITEFRGQVTLQLPIAAREVLRSDAADSVYYMVLGLRGEFVAGDTDLPIPPEDETPNMDGVKFRFDQAHGNDVRIAYAWREFRPNGGAPRYALVQVAETLEKRSHLANEIIRGVIVPQFIVLPIAVVLVWFGLSRGLAPLAALQARIRARDPNDMSPIDPRAAPEEISPVVASFNELLERLSRNMQMQQRFLADAAHQMKTPLAGLRTQAELALRETDPQQLKRSLRQIATSTERATHLINQLLALAQAEHQATDPARFEVVELNALARSVVQESVPDAISKRVDLGFEPAEQPTRIVAVPLLLREMLLNLVDNALRYTPQGGSVTVRIRQQGETAFIDVEDTGPGIPEAERQRVFDRFYRILGTNVDGSGLGLAIVREIVERHDGLLRVGPNPAATDPALPGTLISVEFEAIVGDAPNLLIA
ncbi:MAG: sensor histidine kinase N-terminal domain-containing protein [Burkholderiaceae bacterium]|jgi:two-component system sensor histidine kinase TctE|nr:sensor histidine kinase N-terminal domain-containing protein [Burkholderiaceae bacterium]